MFKFEEHQRVRIAKVLDSTSEQEKYIGRLGFVQAKGLAKDHVLVGQDEEGSGDTLPEGITGDSNVYRVYLYAGGRSLGFFEDELEAVK